MPSAFGLLSDVPSDTPVSGRPALRCRSPHRDHCRRSEGKRRDASSGHRLSVWRWGARPPSTSASTTSTPSWRHRGSAFLPWIGPGLDLDFGPAFRALLPAFVLVGLIESVQTISNAVAVQRASWRRPRAVDYRAVQGMVATAGLGNLVCGIAGTVPNTLLSTSVAVTKLTGGAARRIGIAAGAAFVAMAFLPKVLAAVLAIPGPVVAAYLLVLMATLFVLGMQMIVQGGIDHRKGLIAGVAFWAGVGFQYGAILPEISQDFAGGLLRSGVAAGGLVAILLTLFMEVTQRRNAASSDGPAMCPHCRKSGGSWQGLSRAAVGARRWWSDSTRSARKRC